MTPSSDRRLLSPRQRLAVSPWASLRVLCLGALKPRGLFVIFLRPHSWGARGFGDLGSLCREPPNTVRTGLFLKIVTPLLISEYRLKIL